MAKSLNQLLGYVPLTGVIQKVKTGIPDLLPPAFARVTKRVVGNAGRYYQRTGTRAVAKRAEYGSPARRRQLKGLEVRDVKLAHFFEEIMLDPLLLQTLRNMENYEMQQMGQQEVDYQVAEFATYFDNIRLAMVYAMLSLGHIYFDGEGNLLPSSSGATLDVDFGMSANNLNQLNGIITASWANANTDIPAQLRALRTRATQLTGYPLKYAFYGVNVPTYLTQNNYVLDYLARTPKMAQAFLDTAEVPDGLFGFTWVPVYTAFYEDNDGTNRTFFGGDVVSFTPEINADVYDLIEGSYLVPSSFDAAANMAAALARLKSVYGKFGYAVPSHNPPTAVMYMGDTVLPVWKNPDTVFVADVTP